MAKASLKSIASYIPNKILNNFDLEKMVDTTDEWIVKRTGIKERRIADDDEQTSDLGTKAAIKAIQRANLKIEDIDALLVATLSPDYFTMPSTACKIAANLGLKDITAFDISAACTGFIYLLEQAKAFVESGLKKNVLIIGAEKTSSIIDYNDRSMCILFGDGAGAGIVSLDEQNTILDIHTASNGNFGHLLMTQRSKKSSICHPLMMQMKGNEVFKIAVQTLSNDVIDILTKNNISSKDIDLFIPHQANLRIIKAVQERLNLSDEKCVVTVHKYGNTSAASIPMAMNDAYEEGRLKKGDLILLDAFGGGFTWGSALLKFGGENFKQ
ncbi:MULTISPECIES: beta-ketoacyl-ACP synthase III [Campylobacter]|uniref:beta-ketoacyl-ACP synthase III n=1 Tax=Campylobacter molothri TaxID=1032242 RepID=UPI001D77721F|nr:ketoacyl-ACP synthase III [Campylobacter sp. W0067]MBZ7940017.1 ketoacyl-ACP synthase III [Campylobacter sp. W0047]MBZ7943970.1 ketoacyl-ACP synthase III [Campylobacter sp. RM13744]MBZ7952226.1 ketoacyl-ACP synthase III [Campylobacter sp. RM9939]MBZ7959576.1 ketoacyl-ACP synthase III [Campylobacter sp. RM12397]MBZ7962421.1 ketoacyl-ACP synthase III [Campylobacter sp. W0049]MBZ7965573.1 ketoacyl-ACP synthase III [Campylobacter sp. RM10535]MBZ7969705.1 ketoacyl-ACP synthase III [Campylobact